LEIYLDYLIRYLEVDKIIVFGSFVAREREQRKRDIDILIVSNDFELMSSFMRRNVVKKCMEGLNVDPICMTKKEFNRLKKNNTAFSRQILKTGKIYYERASEKITAKNSLRRSQNNFEV